MELPAFGDRVFQADFITQKRYRRGKLEYLVKWKGYSSKQSTWEPKENILDPLLIAEYESKQSERAKKRRLMKKRRSQREESPCSDSSGSDTECDNSHDYNSNHSHLPMHGAQSPPVSPSSTSTTTTSAEGGPSAKDTQHRHECGSLRENRSSSWTFNPAGVQREVSVMSDCSDAGGGQGSAVDDDNLNAVNNGVGSPVSPGCTTNSEPVPGGTGDSEEVFVRETATRSPPLRQLSQKAPSRQNSVENAPYSIVKKWKRDYFSSCKTGYQEDVGDLSPIPSPLSPLSPNFKHNYNFNSFSSHSDQRTQHLDNLSLLVAAAASVDQAGRDGARTLYNDQYSYQSVDQAGSAGAHPLCNDQYSYHGSSFNANTSLPSPMDCDDSSSDKTVEAQEWTHKKYRPFHHSKPRTQFVYPVSSEQPVKVTVTDVTCNSLRITFMESSSGEGFFKHSLQT